MTVSKYALIASAFLILTACQQTTAETASDASTSETQTETVTEAKYKVAPSGTYDVDKGHAYIVFTYVHQGYSKPLLRWRDWASSLTWDNENPENSSVSVDIKTAKIDTGVDIFDEHLRAGNWFDAENHPDISFKSTSVTKSSDTAGTLTGDLTIKGVTKPVTLDVVFNKAGFSQRSNAHKLGFSATGSLKRSDWGLGNYAPSVGDNVDLTIEAEYEMKAEPK